MRVGINPLQFEALTSATCQAVRDGWQKDLATAEKIGLDSYHCSIVEIYRQLLTTYKEVFYENRWTLGYLHISLIHLKGIRVYISSFHRFKDWSNTLKTQKDDFKDTILHDILNIIVCFLEMLAWQVNFKLDRPSLYLLDERRFNNVTECVRSLHNRLREAEDELLRESFVTKHLLPSILDFCTSSSGTISEIWENPWFKTLAPQFSLFKPIWLEDGQNIGSVDVKSLLKNPDELLPTTMRVPRPNTSNPEELEFGCILMETDKTYMSREQIIRGYVHQRYSEYWELLVRVLNFLIKAQSESAEFEWKFLPPKPDRRTFLILLVHVLMQLFFRYSHCLTETVDDKLRSCYKKRLEQWQKDMDSLRLIVDTQMTDQQLEVRNWENLLRDWITYLSEEAVFEQLLGYLGSHMSEQWDQLEILLILSLEYGGFTGSYNPQGSLGFFSINPEDQKTTKILGHLQRANPGLSESSMQAYRRLRPF